MLNRILLSTVLAVSTAGVARGQTVCDQLLPIGVAPPAGGFMVGCANGYVLKRSYSTGSGSSYIALDYPACANGPCAGMTLPLKFVCETTNGYSCCIEVSQSIPLIAGNYAGPFASGFNARLASDTDTRTGICYADYAGNGSRVCEVPLILPVGLGVSHAQVAGFASMFLKGPLPGNGDLLVEFIGGPTSVHSTTWGETKVRYR